MTALPEQGSAAAGSHVNAGPEVWGAEVIVGVVGLETAWLGAGSMGLLGHALRHALMWVGLGVIVLAAFAAMPHHGAPSSALQRIRGWGLWRGAAILVAAALAVWMTAAEPGVINVLAPALLLGVIAVGVGPSRRILRLVASVAVIFAAYRLVNTSVPCVWLATDRLGEVLGRVGGWVAGQRLRVGATFAGLDYLLVMGVLLALVVAQAPGQRYTLALRGALAIAAAQIAYLVVLAWAPAWVALMTGPVGECPATLAWLRDLAAWKNLVPWNLPLLAGVFQGVSVTLLLRTVALRPAPPTTPMADAGAPRGARLWACGAVVAAVALGAALPMATTIYALPPNVKGKKIVSYKQGFLNWERPEHGKYGRLMIGMYGMFEPYVESLGAKFLRSDDLSDADLHDADIVVLFFPTRTLTDAQLQRVQAFVRRGGSLLLLADHTTHEKIGDDPFVTRDSRSNDLLQPTHMREAFDCADFAIGGWLQSYEALAHPTTVGIGDERNTFGVVIGASVEARWPARPVLVGRWGYGDLGNDGNGDSRMGNSRYDPGEKLGDIILVAEEHYGDGQVFFFGDTSSFVNGIYTSAYPFTARILGYLAQPHSPTGMFLRDAEGILLALLLASVLLWRTSALRTVVAGAVLGAMLAGCVAWTHRATEVLPDGRLKKPNNLAYIDGAHLGAYSEETTRLDGLMGLEYALMRDDYLVLRLPEIAGERLERGTLMLSVAPGRAYTSGECRAVREFVESGGTFILTVGYERASGSQSILNEFGFTVGVPPPLTAPGTEPTPLGHFKSPYVNAGNYMAHVRFHAGWTIKCADENAKPLAYGIGTEPIIMLREVGKGRVIVIGDSAFATNQNLEHEHGEPFEGMRENADFWRWLLSYLRGGNWTPPPPPAPVAPAPRRATSAPQPPAVVPSDPETEEGQP